MQCQPVLPCTLDPLRLDLDSRSQPTSRGSASNWVGARRSCRWRLRASLARWHITRTLLWPWPQWWHRAMASRPPGLVAVMWWQVSVQEEGVHEGFVEVDRRSGEEGDREGFCQAEALLLHHPCPGPYSGIWQLTHWVTSVLEPIFHSTLRFFKNLTSFHTRFCPLFSVVCDVCIVAKWYVLFPVVPNRTPPP